MPNWVFNKVYFYGDKEKIKEIKDAVSTEDNKFDFNKIVPMPDNIYCGPLGQEEMRLYGKNNWYDWSWDNWGTKWNASDVCWSGDNFVSFSTAWNTPEKVFKALAEKYPDVEFSVSFADEDLGNNCGTIDYDKETGFDVLYQDDFDFACDVWGYDPDEMREEYCYE